jgi:hypothetical protein
MVTREIQYPKVQILELRGVSMDAELLVLQSDVGKCIDLGRRTIYSI